MSATDVRTLLEKTDRDRTAFICQGRRYTYDWLNQHSQRLANGIAKILRPGEILTIWLPNSPELVSLYFACLRCGVLPMPLHRDMRGDEIQKILTGAAARVMVTTAQLLTSTDEILFTTIDRIYVTDGSGTSARVESWNSWLLEPAAHQLPALEESAPAFILGTSGSEGQSKGVVLSYRNLNHILAFRLECTGLTADSITVVGSCLTQSVGLHQVLAMLAAGGLVVLFEDYHIDLMAEAINRYRPTHLMMVVNAFSRLLQHSLISAESFENIAFAAAGADRITEALQRRYIGLTGRPLNVTYGMTESSWALLNDQGKVDKALSIGKPAKHVEIRLVDHGGGVLANHQVGEIQIRSPRTMLGYLNMPTLTDAAFSGDWLLSGDLAYRDDEGFYWFVGRKKALIVRSTGDVVSPVQIEQAIIRNNLVKDCLVVSGRSLEEDSEVPIAFVTTDDASLCEADLQEELAEILSPYKLPYRIHIVPELPAGPTGKLVRKTPGDYDLEFHS